MVVERLGVDGNVCISGDPKYGLLKDLDTRKEAVKVGRDDLFERHCLGAEVGMASEQMGRDLDSGEPTDPTLWIGDEHAQVQRQRADVRKRVAGIHGERCEDGEHLVGVELTEFGLLSRAEAGPVDQHKRLLCLSHCLCQFERDPLRHMVLFSHHRKRQVDLALRRNAVVDDTDPTVAGVVLHGRDTYQEVLVEIVCPNRDEPHAVRVGQRPVFGQSQDTTIKLMPRQLPIYETRVGCRGDVRRVLCGHCTTR